MAISRRVMLTLAGVSALAGTGLAAKAIADRRDGEGGGWSHGWRRGGWHSHGWRNGNGVDGIAEHLEEELALTDAQRPAWRALVDEIKAVLAEEDLLSFPRTDPATPAPDTVAVYRAKIQGVLAAIDRLEPRFAAFYEQLSGEQRKKVDAALARHYRR